MRKERAFLHLTKLLTLLAAIACFGFLLFTIWIKNEGHWFPLHVVKVYGLSHVTKEEVTAVIRPYLTQGFFSLHLPQMQEQLARHPWVAEVSVQRKWPDELRVVLTEHQPVARWNDRLLLSDHGTLFKVQDEPAFATLPLLRGPPDSYGFLWDQWQKTNRILQNIHVRITKLELDTATWKLTLDNGIVLYVAYHDLLKQASRFVTVYPKLLQTRSGTIATIDLRYSNGMAVQWMDAV